MNVVTGARLMAEGWTRKRIEAALDAGQLIRVARGWYATRYAHPWEVEALKAGGRLGCLSGCQFHGLWTPTHRDPHIIIPTYRGLQAGVASGGWTVSGNRSLPARRLSSPGHQASRAGGKSDGA